MCCLVSTRANIQSPRRNLSQQASKKFAAASRSHLDFAWVRQGSGRGQDGIRQGSRGGQQESAGPHPSNLPANPDHQGSKKVAWQVLNNREGRHKDDQHEEGHYVAIDAGIHSRPHGEDGLTKDVAAGEASARDGSCHVGPTCSMNKNSLLSLSGNK